MKTHALESHMLVYLVAGLQDSLEDACRAVVQPTYLVSRWSHSCSPQGMHVIWHGQGYDLPGGSQLRPKQNCQLGHVPN